MNGFIQTLMLSAIWTLLLAPGIIQAQPKGRGMSRMMYNPGTEITLKGSVEDVAPGTRGMMGTHLTVKTAGGETQVMLGPTNFVAGKGFTFAKGDQVEITGSNVTMGETEWVIAREVKKNGQTLTLRDKTGTPAWSGGTMGRGDKP
jgi:hypothetical protein